MSRVAISIGRVTPAQLAKANEELGISETGRLVLEEYEVGVVMKALAEARSRGSMPHEARVIDRVSDALQQGVR